MEKRINLLNKGSDYLAQRGIGNALGESEMLLAYILNCTRVELYLDNLAVKEQSLQCFQNLLSRRAEGFPLQYLLGSVEFMGYTFKTRPGVFIPRPETEILVETVLNILTNGATILDLGTGCGNIAISIARGLKQADVFACDISDFALQLVQENTSFNKANIKIVSSNLFSGFKKEKTFSLIVSNPPYIKKDDLSRLARELSFEHSLALDGGKDGLCYYRQIVQQAPDYLRPDGMLAFELGDGQAEAVKEIFAQSGGFSLIKLVRDYNDRERVIVARKVENNNG
ncbi:MAG: peptide chain release factor N(5)-glutamine methyltransferase [Candidatus Omnitrophica bacterium]|nr:peptide chain release factor N(5)-glutamine methyltransferase [Candidatus Omnitrophota bacterium]